MKPKPIYDIESVTREHCRNDYIRWIDLLAKESLALLPKHNLIPDTDRLLEDFNVAFDFGINAMCRVDDTAAILSKIEPYVKRFLGVARLIDKEMEANSSSSIDPRVVEKYSFEEKQYEKLNELENLQKEYLAHPNDESMQRFQAIARSFRFLEFNLQDPNTITNALNVSRKWIEMEEYFEGEHFESNYESPSSWVDPSSISSNLEFVFPCKALSAFVKARYMLDFTPNVSLEGIAILAGVSRRTVTNAINSNDPDNFIELASEYSKQNSFFGACDYIVDSNDAREWLCKRYRFIETIEKDSPVTNTRHRSPSNLVESNSNETMYTVPQAKDGSLFSPSCSSRNGFTIGPKGSEFQVSDFEEALESLSRMKKPYWRRRNNKGRLGIVTGVTWVNVPKSEL